MKLLAFVSLLVISAGLLRAQIPNAGFEDWTSAGSYETPDQWGNMNAATAVSGVYTTIKGSPGAGGDHYIKLTTKDVGGVITPGMIVSGQLNTGTWQPVSGFPFNQRVEKLVGKYQFMGYNDDVATIAAWLTRWNAAGQRRDTIASFWYNTTGMIHVWTAFSIPFAYQSEEAPDSAIVFISSSSHKPKKNSFIWLDDLAFEGMATGIDDDFLSAADFRVYPSPASEYLNLTFNSSDSYTSRITITDLPGKVLSFMDIPVHPGSNSFTADLGNFSRKPGIYFIQMTTPRGQLARRFIICQ